MMCYCGCKMLQVSPWLHHIRRLTSGQVATALRPFYFAVHPDLFGKQPHQRQINEDSMKRLTEHLSKLQSQKSTQPLTLKFFLRDTQKDKTQNAIVHIKLGESATIYASVKHILKTCGLPLDYITTLKPTVRPVWSRPTRLDSVFHNMYGPREEATSSKPVIEYRDWLAENIPTARQRNLQIQPILNEVSRLRQEILKLTGVEDIVWASGWSQTQHRAALQGLMRLASMQPGLSLAGRTLILTHSTGISCHGDILIKSNEIAETWLPLLKSPSKYEELVNKLPAIELYLSTLLNNARLRRTFKNTPLVGVYMMELRRLISAVRHHLAAEPGSLTVDLHETDIVVECMTGPLLVMPSGVIRISSSTPGFLVIDHLNKNHDKSQLNKLTYERNNHKMNDLMSRCHTNLRLQSLTFSDSLTPTEVICCCENLLDEFHGYSLSDTLVHITNFFSVTSEGTICIPWNFGGT